MCNVPSVLQCCFPSAQIHNGHTHVRTLEWAIGSHSCAPASGLLETRWQLGASMLLGYAIMLHAQAIHTLSTSFTCNP